MSAVDVVVPCYNYARYLERCVGSVLDQSGVDVRVLIVDDASSDNSAEVGQAIAARDPRVTYHRNPKNLGLVGTANVGVMDWATAKYTLLLSADDAVTRGALSRAAKVMDAHEDVGMTYGMALVVPDESAMVETPDDQEFEYRVMQGSEFLRQSCVHWCGVASPTAVIRTAVQHQVGGLDPRLPHTCDMEIWMRIATRASIAAMKPVQAYYRRHDTNMSSDYINTPLSDLREQLDTATTVITNWATHMPESEIWMRDMKRRMVEQACWMAGLAFERGDDAGARECLAFAAQHTDALWRSNAWRRFQAKRLAGRKLLQGARSIGRSARRASRATEGDFSPFEQGEQFGWWPEIGAREMMTR
jgi:hypothetical protein